ncbi:MAG TPA: hypothetical protein VG164_06695, partial [Trebonia sp.]|nr:hypothetical protein [Trebonia sp.]
MVHRITPGAGCSSFHPGACLAWWWRAHGGYVALAGRLRPFRPGRRGQPGAVSLGLAGTIVVGSDSHTPVHGVLGALGV